MICNRNRYFLGLLACMIGSLSTYIDANGNKKNKHGRWGYHHKKGQGGRGAQNRRRSQYHVHKWEGHQGKRADWQTRWHGGRGFNRYIAHVWHQYGWFWDRESRTWYRCTPVDDPKRGYGCEYKNIWYSMVKEEPKMTPTEYYAQQGAYKKGTKEIESWKSEKASTAIPVTKNIAGTGQKEITRRSQPAMIEQKEKEEAEEEDIVAPDEEPEEKTGEIEESSSDIPEEDEQKEGLWLP
jgi:hypothetical protein